MLTELGGLTKKELVQKLGMSISGTKSRVQHRRNMLREKFFECCKFQFDAYGNIIEYQHKKRERSLFEVHSITTLARQYN